MALAADAVRVGMRSGVLLLVERQVERSEMHGSLAVLAMLMVAWL